MFYDTMKDRTPEHFKRLSGVSKETFALMIQVLQERLPAFGRPPTLSVEDHLLMVLMYWREYRTQEHIGSTYGVYETTAGRTVKQFEPLLIQDTRFHLPGKKALRHNDTIFEIVLMDATECPCERPKKTESLLLGQEETAHPKGPGNHQQSHRTDHRDGVL